MSQCSETDTPERLEVGLADRSYDIVIGRHLIGKAGSHIAPLLDCPRVIIVTDANIAPLHLGTLKSSLEEAGIEHDEIILEPGEATKDMAHLENLTNRLLELRVERQTTLIALGGGMVGDITGFAAAITLRGLPVIQIPTTLLAQVDSSVGGKTGINTKFGKNLIGAFHQPALVLTDIDSLDTLPRRELLAGYAEVVKYGLINDAEFFVWLEANFASLLDGSPASRHHAISTSCAAKAGIVVEDERESGRRALLNLGHTFAHALEAESGYSDTLRHGEAVAVGICLAFELSARLRLCDDADAERVRRHIEKTGLPANLCDIAGPSWSAGRLIAHMKQDKKVRNERMTFILARAIGNSFITDNVDIGDVHSLLEDALGT